MEGIFIWTGILYLMVPACESRCRICVLVPKFFTEANQEGHLCLADFLMALGASSKKAAVYWHEATASPG